MNVAVSALATTHGISKTVNTAQNFNACSGEAGDNLVQQIRRAIIWMTSRSSAATGLYIRKVQMVRSDGPVGTKEMSRPGDYEAAAGRSAVSGPDVVSEPVGRAGFIAAGSCGHNDARSKGLHS